MIQKSGAWYSFGEERLGQGRENVRVFLKENQDLYGKIKELVFTHYGIGKNGDEKTEETTEAKTEGNAAAAPKAAAAQAGKATTASTTTVADRKR